MKYLYVFLRDLSEFIDSSHNVLFFPSIGYCLRKLCLISSFHYFPPIIKLIVRVNSFEKIFHNCEIKKSNGCLKIYSIG